MISQAQDLSCVPLTDQMEIIGLTQKDVHIALWDLQPRDDCVAFTRNHGAINIVLVDKHPAGCLSETEIPQKPFH